MRTFILVLIAVVAIAVVIFVFASERTETVRLRPTSGPAIPSMRTPILDRGVTPSKTQTAPTGHPALKEHDCGPECYEEGRR